MSRLPVSSRTAFAGVAIVGVLVLIQATVISDWLALAARAGFLVVVPLTFVAVLVVGAWSGVRYVRDRQWQD